MAKFDRVLGRVIDALITFGTLAGVLMFLVVTFNTIARYVFHTGFAPTEDLAGLLFSAVLFITIPYVAQMRQDIRVTLLVERMPGPIQRIMELVSAALVLLFAVIFAKLSYDFSAVSYRVGSESAVGRLVLYPWMSVMPISIGLLGLVAARDLIAGVRQRTVHSAENAPAPSGRH